MEIKLQEMDKIKQETQKLIQSGGVKNVENLKMKDMIKELEEKVSKNLTLNSLEGKIDIKPIK